MRNQMKSQSIPAPTNCTAFARNNDRTKKTLAQNHRNIWSSVNNDVPDGHPKSHPYLSRRQFDPDPHCDLRLARKIRRPGKVR